MKNLDYKVYLDKVRACWLGKNVGGTLGAPFECFQGVVDLDFYTHDISKGVLPNDDLDLQLVWLLAAEQEGKRVNAETLANYWLMYVVPDWSEYGYCKRNLRAGLLPSVSGGFHLPL
ncbi:MAG: ADP-ribosylglycohydrolase family protein [Ruminococcaceae bacterium]|nr:ADP-ribosylglycohydrolase family protein [Oscillospiraceae bacterium]